MHTKVSSSRTGVKIIHANPGDVYTLARKTMAALAKLTQESRHRGVTLWYEHDDEVNLTVWHCEVGSKHFQSTDLAYCILEANGQLPMKRCGRCPHKLPITAFPRDRDSPDGRGYLCNKCNRLQVSAKARA